MQSRTMELAKGRLREPFCYHARWVAQQTGSDKLSRICLRQWDRAKHFSSEGCIQVACHFGRGGTEASPEGSVAAV